MKKLTRTKNGQADPHDEIYLALCFLHRVGVSNNQLRADYGLGKTKLNEITHGKPLVYNRSKYQQALLQALIDKRQRLLTGSRLAESERSRTIDLLTRVIIEMARVAFGMPHDEEVWGLIPSQVSFTAP